MDVLEKLEPLSEQKGLLKFLRNEDHAGLLSGFVQDIVQAVTDYQVDGMPPPPYAAHNMDPDNVSPLTSGSHLQSISSMTAVERSPNLRVAKTKPHLEFMVGPLLRYDTIENGIWRGAALIVSECAFFWECVYHFLASILWHFGA